MLSQHNARQVARSNQAASTSKGKDLVHSKHRVRRLRPSPSSTRASDPGGRPKHYLQGHRSDALTALTDRGSSTWHPPLNEGPVVGIAFDDGVDDTRHLGGNSGHRLAAQIGIVAISRDVAFELVPESVLALTDGDLSGEPQGAAQSRIAELGKAGLASILA